MIPRKAPEIKTDKRYISESFGSKNTVETVVDHLLSKIFG